jgi:hypothetical protein
MTLRRALLPLAFLAAAAPLPAFTVAKNVNSGKPPVEKLVLFEKGKVPPPELKDATGQSRMGFASDGAIEIAITGNKEVRPTIFWRPSGDFKGTFNAKEYEFMLLTCKVEGNAKRKFPNGKVSADRPDNLWIGPSLVNAQDQRAGSVNLADVADDEKTPSQMVTLKIPMVLFTQLAGNDTSEIKAIGFHWGKTHDYMDRDFRIVVERIVLAN